MSITRRLAAAAAVLGPIVLYVGCAKEAPPAPAVPDAPPPAATEESTDAAADTATDAEATADAEATNDVADSLAALSEADRAAVLAQKICPVSGQELGGMGTPIKVEVAGRTVFICCPNCKEPLLANPDKYLAKLEAK